MIQIRADSMVLRNELDAVYRLTYNSDLQRIEEQVYAKST